MTTNIKIDNRNGTFSLVNDSKTQLTFHEFELEHDDYYAQIFLYPGAPEQQFTIFVSYNHTPHNMDYEYTANVPNITGLFPEDTNDPNTIVTLPKMETPYIHILPKEFANRTGPYVIGVLVEGKHSKKYFTY